MGIGYNIRVTLEEKIHNNPDDPLGIDEPEPTCGIFEEMEYPEFFFWRAMHGVLPEDDWTVNDPNPTDYRCPRCHSTEVIIGYPYIECQHCGYNEPLIDFPISHYYHLALGRII